MAAHSSPLVHFLLMDDKGGEDEIKASRSCMCVCVCVCRVDESRCDVLSDRSCII